MSDASKLCLVLGLIPVLMLSIFGFAASFQPVNMEESAEAGRLLQRVVCGSLALGSLALMARLATIRPVALHRH